MPVYLNVYAQNAAVAIVSPANVLNANVLLQKNARNNVLVTKENKMANSQMFWVDEWDYRPYNIEYRSEEDNFARFLMCEMPDYLI